MKITRLPFLPLLLLLSASPAALGGRRSSGDSELARLPFRPLGNLVLFDVQLEGGAPVTLLLDSGASSIVLDASVADALGLAMGPQRKGGKTSQGGQLTFRIAPSVAADIAGYEVELANVLVAPCEEMARVMMGTTVHGILGHPFLARHTVELDYERGEMVVHDPAKYRYAGDGAALALEFDGTFGNLPFVRATVEATPDESHTVRMLVDTGGSVLTTCGLSEKATAAAVIPASARRIPALGATGLGNTPEETMHDNFLTRLHRFQLGPYAIDRPTVSCRPDGGVNLFGAEALGRFHVVLDYERDRMILEPNAAFGTPTRADTSGMTLFASAEDASVRRVAFVVPGGPADEAGIARDDELISIEGEPASQEGLQAIRERFLEAGTYRLVLRRGTETLDVVLEAREIL